MEDAGIKTNKKFEIEDTEKKSAEKEDFQIKFTSCIMGIENVIAGKLDKSKLNDLDYNNKLEEYDNTNANIIFSKLKLKKTNKLLFDSFDILDKEQLLQFNIIKKFSNREAYFYFLEYIADVQNIDEKEKNKEVTEKEKKEKKSRKPDLTIDCSKGNIEIINNVIKKRIHI